MRMFSMVVAGLAAATMSTSAYATQVLAGTVSSVALFNPTVTLSADPSTYSALNGATFEISGTGGFAAVDGTNGQLNGTLSFSNTVGTVLAESLSDFFVFSDAAGGTYNYSVASVRTNAFVNTADYSSGTLYLLGNLVDINRNQLTPTPASLSIQFNSTGGSAYSSALTLAVSPAGAVPEAATWITMIGGMGMIGATMRRRRTATLANA